MTTSKNSSINASGVLFLVALTLAWEVLARLNGTPNMPTVGAVIGSLWHDAGLLATEASYTLGRALAGLAIALLAGIPLGIAFGRIRLLGDLAMPAFDLLRPLPPIAIAPVAMIFAGTGTAAKVAVIAYGCLFPILITTFDAVRTTQPQLVQSARALGMNRLEIMWLIDFPSELPRMMTGVRISLALCLLIAVSTELLLSSNGLGAYIMRAQQLFRIADGLAALAVIAALGLAIGRIYALVDRRLLAWHHERLALAGGGNAA
ncbi:ABC transporter permease subunit [Mesorhizobium sp. CC13]|uniref:ABC transporter permease n=1 Tax=Mesorhizobium sp. CC13 TaxID=3029194 RepID=UPI0032648FCF